MVDYFTYILCSLQHIRRHFFDMCFETRELLLYFVKRWHSMNCDNINITIISWITIRYQYYIILHCYIVCTFAHRGSRGHEGNQRMRLAITGTIARRRRRARRRNSTLRRRRTRRQRRDWARRVRRGGS